MQLWCLRHARHGAVARQHLTTLLQILCQKQILLLRVIYTLCCETFWTSTEVLWVSNLDDRSAAFRNGTCGGINLQDQRQIRTALDLVGVPDKGHIGILGADALTSRHVLVGHTVGNTVGNTVGKRSLVPDADVISLSNYNDH